MTKSRIGPMVPLERAAKAARLPALDLKRTRQNDLARKFKAVVSGRPLPKKTTPVDPDRSKYGDDEG